MERTQESKQNEHQIDPPPQVSIILTFISISNGVLLLFNKIMKVQSFPKEPLDLDDLLPVLGEYGCYQKLLLWFICLPACIPCGFCAFNQLFMTDKPDDYFCNVPQLSEFNLTIDQIRSVAIPSTQVNYS